MANKNSFVLQVKLKAVVAKLSDKQAGVLFKGILEYAANGTVANFDDGMVDVVFEMVKQDLDYTAQRYAETCAKRAESGRLGGLANQANASKCKQMLESESKIKQSQAKSSKAKHNDNENDNENDVITTKPPLPPYGGLNGKPLSQAFAKWLNYRKQIKKPYKSKMSLDECYARLEKLSGGDVNVADKIVSQSIAQGWQGLFELKEDGGKGNAGTDYNRNPDEDKYDGFGRKI